MNLALERAVELPWTRLPDEQKRFNTILIVVLLISLLCSVAIPFIKVPEPERKKVEELPPRLAKLIIEKKTPPPPPPPKVEKKPVKKPEVKKKPVPVKKPPVKKPVVAKKDPDSARKKAMSAGILAFKDDLADLRKSASTQSVQSRDLQKGGNEAKRTTRSIIATNARTGSGGIDTSRLSRDTGGGSLAGRSVTQVESNLKAEKGKSARRSGNSNKGSRSYESIQIVFDRNKGSLYSIYNRALRKDPTLQGKVVLELTISPSGSVTQCKVISSELNNSSLERKLVARIKLFNFGAQDVDTIIVKYPIDFLPS